MQKDQYVLHDFTYLWILKKVKFTEAESEMVVTGGWRVADMGRRWSGGIVLVMQDEHSGDIMVNVVSIVSNTVTIT